MNQEVSYYLNHIYKLLPHLGPGTERLREAIEDKDYNGALYIISDIKEKRQLSKEQIDSLDELQENIINIK